METIVIDGMCRWRQFWAIKKLHKLLKKVIPHSSNNPTNAQKALYKETMKKDWKATFSLHQCVDESHFEKIAGVATLQEAWRILEECNDGAEKLKNVILQTMRRQYELMQMEKNKKILEFFNRIITHTNAMKNYGETIPD